MKHETEIPSIDDIILVKDAKEIFGIGKVDPKLIWNANMHQICTCLPTKARVYVCIGIGYYYCTPLKLNFSINTPKTPICISDPCWFSLELLLQSNSFLPLPSKISLEQKLKPVIGLLFCSLLGGNWFCAYFCLPSPSHGQPWKV